MPSFKLEQVVTRRVADRIFKSFCFIVNGDRRKFLTNNERIIYKDIHKQDIVGSEWLVKCYKRKLKCYSVHNVFMLRLNAVLDLVS